MSLLRWHHLLWFKGIALFAVLFGLLTLSSGGAVLFNRAARQAAGNYVEFIVWFNFLVGFAYVITGIGLWRWQRWAYGVVVGNSRSHSTGFYCLWRVWVRGWQL